MERETTNTVNPKQGIWRRFLLLIPLVAVLAIASCAHISKESTVYTMGGHRPYTDEEFAAREAVVSDPSVLEVESVEHSPRGGVFVKVRALDDGACTVRFAPKGRPDTVDAEAWYFKVLHGHVYSESGDFEGWEALHVSLIVLLAALVALFTSCAVRLWRASWYGYTMVVCAACALFCAFQFLLFALLRLNKTLGSINELFYFVGMMVAWFAIASALPMFVICLLVSLSNISLIIHEGRRPINMLGIAASLMLGALYLYLMLGGGVGFFYSWVVHFTAFVAITFGVCLLLSVMICASLAARHKPRRVMDYIVILGCGIRPDGTPCPLLAGRVDRAVSYARELALADDQRPVYFVPSGGQGPDEPMSEAQSMRDYLVSTHDIDPERIVMEDRSTTTSENMAFSREVIERHAGRDVSELSVGFSTTNYHVFRGYVCAHRAGMDVEGMGSTTKYYFWPNAFLREFIGLLAAKWRAMLLLFLLLFAASVLVNLLVGRM